MAKYEDHLHCDFRGLLTYLNDYILNGSISASLEDGSEFCAGDVRCVTRVYERYSWTGKNRLSLTLTLFGRDGDVRVSAITAGGSQGLFITLNTCGESAFLEAFLEGLEKYKKAH